MGDRAVSLDELGRRIDAREAVVGVVGLGYVGLPLACTMAERGLRVIGFDVDPRKVEILDTGGSYIRHIPAARIAALRGPTRDLEHWTLGRSEGGGFVATSRFDALGLCDAILVCVPTPLADEREPDLRYVRDTAAAIAGELRRGQLVVLESTTYPGTTEEEVRPILEREGLRAGADFALAYSPEREDPANRDYATDTIPKLVGGVTPRCRDLAAALYRIFVDRVVPVSSTQVAEAAKLLENVFRGVNIALVNELKMLLDRMGIDVWEVIDAAATKPFGFMPFYPGPGLGGHCIPIDPFYLAWKARQVDFSTRFIELAGEINTAMPDWVVERVASALTARGTTLREARILVLGVAYKRDVDDLRESPALRLIELLGDRGASVAYNDPYVPALHERDLRHYGRIDMESVPLSREALAEYDCVLVATDHGAYDWNEIVASSRLVVDTRNATRNVRDGREKIVKA